MSLNRNNKDESPEKTIETIRTILGKIGFDMVEKDWKSLGNVAFSLNLNTASFRVHPRHRIFGSNGKGISREFARASAYAEFMERLQNLHPTTFPPTFGLMPEELRPLDLERKTLKAIHRDNPEVFCALFEPSALSALGDTEVDTLPYYNIKKNRVDLLPSDAITLVCESNGMCAGNTREEALVQGINELFERYVTKTIFFENIRLPTITTETLTKLSTYEIIRVVEEASFKVVVKDATLGGKYPVLAILVFDPEKNKYHIHFGASATFDIALQRCLTEAYQGVSMANNQRMKKIKWNDHWTPAEKLDEWREFVLSGRGKYPESVLQSGPRASFEAAFETAFVSNKATLSFLLDIAQRNGHDVFIRDVSFLGFPAYRVFIPQISPIHPKLTAESYALYQVDVPRVRKVLLSLKSASLSDIEFCTKTLAQLHQDPRYCNRVLVPRLCQALLKSDSDFSQLYDLDFLLCILYHRLGDFEKAHLHLRNHIEDPWADLNDTQAEVTNKAYYWGALAFFGLLSNKLDLPTIKNSLADIYRPDLAQEIVEDLSSPERAFQYYDLPTCGNCEVCPAVEQCYYPQWMGFAQRLRQSLRDNPIAQADLASAFENILPKN